MIRRFFTAARLLAGPVLLIGLGLYAAFGWFQAGQKARAYRVAPACTPRSDALHDNCITVLPAQLTAVRFSTSGGSMHANLRVKVGAAELSARLDSVSPGDESLLQPGTGLSVTLYRQRVTAIDLAAHRWLASANPIVEQSRQGMVALLMLGLGTLGLVLALYGGGWLAALVTRFATSPPAAASPMLSTARVGTIYPLTVRPRSAFRSKLLFIVPALALGAVQLYLRTRFQGVGLVIAAGFVGLLAGSFGLRWLYLRTARLFVDDFNVGQSGLFVSRRAVPRSEVTRVFICRVIQPRGPASRRVLVLGRDGRTLVKITGEDFSMDEVTAVAQDLGVPIEGSWDQAFTPAQLRSRFPASSGWFEAHTQPIGIGFGIALCLIVTMWLLLVGKR